MSVKDQHFNRRMRLVTKLMRSRGVTAKTCRLEFFSCKSLAFSSHLISLMREATSGTACHTNTPQTSSRRSQLIIPSQLQSTSDQHRACKRCFQRLARSIIGTILSRKVFVLYPVELGDLIITSSDWVHRTFSAHPSTSKSLPSQDNGRFSSFLTSIAYYMETAFITYP